MPVHFVLHLASILAAAIVVAGAPDTKTWLSVAFALGFAHYLLSILYSGRQIRQLFEQPQVIVPLLWIGLVGAALYLLKFPLILYFAFHHAFNTAYILNDTIKKDDELVRAFRGSSVWLHLFIYLVLLRSNSPLDNLAPGALFAGVAVGYIVFFYYLYRLRTRLDARSLIENCGFELLSIGAIAASFYFDFKFLQVVLYHFIFWAFYPAWKLAHGGIPRLARYLALTGACIAFFWAVSPIGLVSYRLIGSPFEEQFYLWSYIHITTSLMLSNAHPAWIVGLFRPRRLTKAA